MRMRDPPGTSRTPASATKKLGAETPLMWDINGHYYSCEAGAKTLRDLDGAQIPGTAFPRPKPMKRPKGR